MNDALKHRIQQFIAARDWDQFHSPENLAKSLIIEAAELLEHFQWGGDFDPDAVADELADTMIYAYQLAWKLGLDTDTIIARKQAKNELKYPVEKAYGSSRKYTEFTDA